MNNKNLKRFLFASVLLPITLLNTSCAFSSAFLAVEPLRYKALAQKGSGSLALCAYYDDKNLTFSDDLTQIEEAFKGEGKEDDYQIIVYDAVRGLDLCQEYGNYASVATIARGNQQFVPLKENIDNTKTLKVLCNNEFGSLGKTAKKVLTKEEGYEAHFTDMNDLEYYNFFLNGEFSSLDYDYAFISEPYATRLMTLKESPLYDKNFDEYTSNDDRDSNEMKNVYCESLQDFYVSMSGSNETTRLGIPQTGIFVNKEFYKDNYLTMDKVFNLINKEISNKYVIDVGYTRLDFINLSEEFNDPNEDVNSEQTKRAYKAQFDKVGISWNEAVRLQAWHSILGQDAPFEKYINRLEYSKNITSYYTDQAYQTYYSFIGEDMPDSSNFIKLAI